MVIFNFRADRVIEISKALEYKDFDKFDRKRFPDVCTPPLCLHACVIACMPACMCAPYLPHAPPAPAVPAKACRASSPLFREALCATGLEAGRMAAHSCIPCG